MTVVKLDVHNPGVSTENLSGFSRYSDKTGFDTWEI